MKKSYHAGGRFVYEMLKELSGRHEIDLVTRLEKKELPYLEDLKPFCREIYPYTYESVNKRSLLDITKLVLNYIGFSLYANKLVRKGYFDIVQVEWVESALMIRKGSTPMILDAHDVITKPTMRRYLLSTNLFQKIINYITFRILERMELYIARKFDRIFTRSKTDRDILIGLDKRLNIDIVPHPVISDNAGWLSNQPREPNTILFSGAMHRQVNIQAVLYFYKEILPFIRKEIPGVKFYIVGNNPPDEIKRLAQNDENVVVTGFVDDLEPYYLKASVFVSPMLIGGGIIAKNIDAMFYGLPVVTTSVGNEGIEAVPEEDVLVADTPQEFAKKVIKALKDRQLWKQLSFNGNKFVKEGFSQEKIQGIIEKAYRELNMQ
jgi:glycosyltransferase involved in cell wall biosynthesis